MSYFKSKEDGEIDKAEADGAVMWFPQIGQKYEKIRGSENLEWLKLGCEEVKA